jgi:hypothetical protein
VTNEWILNDNVVAVSSNTYTVKNVQADGTIQVTFKLITGIEDVQTGIKIYTKNSSVLIESSSEITLVEIYNLFGQLIRHARVNDSWIKIDNLPDGVLVIKVSLQDEKTEMKKVLIK